MSVEQAALRAGIPGFGGGGGAPFDDLTDMLRGLKGIVTDMYRRPELIFEAMERIVPVTIKSVVEGANRSLSPILMMPLHKGNDSFMSEKQFEKFYWPTFRKVLMGCIEEGLVPMPFAKGSYRNLLDIITDLPEGSIIWWFEDMDMAKAKQALDSRACIAGNVPTSIICTGTPAQVKAHCRKLIETCGPGGGYILAAAASVSRADPDNFRAMMEAAAEYGTYR